MHAFNTEVRSPEVKWPFSVPAIQSVIKNSPSLRLGGRSPITVHTGVPSGNLLSVALSETKMRKTRSINEARLMQNLNVESLNEELDAMHKEVQETLLRTREQSIDLRNIKTHIMRYTPIVGDYIVVACMFGPRTKMSTHWVGTRRVTWILSDFTVEVEHLLQDFKKIVHIYRIRPYADALAGNRVHMKVAEFADRIWHSVDKIKDIREISLERTYCGW